MIRVLLVDDEPDALTLLDILLQRTGGVQVAGKYVNPMQAIEALRTTPVDAVFLDNEMPGMKGMEAARRMREIRPKLPIVFITAHAEYAVEAFEIQSTDYLLKPLRMNRLQNAVSRIKQAVAAAQAPRDPETANISIHCMGGFGVSLPQEANRPLPWKTNKEKEICAFLVHHGENPVDTAVIIESIWPEYDLKNAKTYLYTCLSYLRKSFQDHQLPMRVEKSGGGFAIRLNGAEADASVFEKMLDDALSAEQPDEQLIDKLNGLYKGKYMEGCGYRWAEFKQEEIDGKYIRVLRKMHLQFRRCGNASRAEDSLRRILAIAPDSEADGRDLIRLHLEAGNRSKALHVYRQLEQAVREQLGVELEEETVKLFDQIGWSG